MSSYLIFGYNPPKQKHASSKEIEAYQAIFRKIMMTFEYQFHEEDKDADIIAIIQRNLVNITQQVAMKNKGVFSYNLAKRIDDCTLIDFMLFSIHPETSEMGVFVIDPFIAPEDMADITQDMERLFSLVLNKLDSDNTQDFYKDVEVGFFVSQENTYSSLVFF